MNPRFFISIFIFLFALALGAPALAAAACARFRVHTAAELPKIMIQNNRPQPLPATLSGALETWKDKIDFLQTPTDREAWLNCVQQFIFLDTDRDGVADWTAVVDGRPSRVLFPLDPDLDGDGIINLLDADPYVKNSPATSVSIPLHLRASGEVGHWQELLFTDFGVLAVNHGDEHTAETLKVFHEILKLKSVNTWMHKRPLFQALYAFSSHGSKGEIAAFHATAEAISISGARTYSEAFSMEQKCKIASALLHELGHAYVFKILSNREFHDVAVKLGGWSLPVSNDGNIWSPPWLKPFAGPHSPFISEYAETNSHEWFAESFAAHIWEKENLNNKFCAAFPGAPLPKKLNLWFDKLLRRPRK